MSNEHEIASTGATRQDFLKKAGVAAALAAGGIPMWAKPAGAFARQSPRPLKLGFFNAFTGALANGGIDCRQGFDLYLQAKGGKLNGRPVEVIYEDDGGNPANSLTKARKLTEQDKVHILVGGINAASGPPVFQYANEVGIPWINPLIATDELTQRLPNSYMVRVGGTASTMSRYFAEWIRKNRRDIKNVAVCSWDFLFGYQNSGGFQDVFQRLGGAVVQRIWIPLGTADHTPFISRIDTSVDAVYSAFGSIDAVRFLGQAFQLGLKQRLPIIGNWTLTDETVLAALPADAALGVLTDGRYSGILPNRANQDLQRRFNAVRSDPVSNNVTDGWVAAQTVEAGLRVRKNDTSNRRKFAAAFKGVTLTTPRGPMRIDSSLNPVQNVYIRRVDRAGSRLPPGYKLPLQNTILATVPNGNQYWKFNKSSVLARPSYSRDYPPLKPRR